MSEDVISTTSEIPQVLQAWIDYYNNPDAQNPDSQSHKEVKKALSKKALELEETQTSFDQRRFSIVHQDIELEVVGKNQGSFWLLPQDNKGWLFPKLSEINQANWSSVKTLFKVDQKETSYHYIQVIKPALLTASDAEGKIWTLLQPGHILLTAATATHTARITKQTPPPEPQTSPLSPEKLEQQLRNCQEQLTKQAQARQKQKEQLETLLTLVQQLDNRLDRQEEKLQDLQSSLTEIQTPPTASPLQHSAELQIFLNVYNSASIDNIHKTFTAICLEAVLNNKTEFTIESKHRGDYWIFPQPDGKDTGWLFPKLPITPYIGEQIESQLFECQESQKNSNRAAIIKPAQVSRFTPNPLEIWKLEVTGELIWSH